jgi:hypothetical protein
VSFRSGWAHGKSGSGFADASAGAERSSAPVSGCFLPSAISRRDSLPARLRRRHTGKSQGRKTRSQEAASVGTKGVSANWLARVPTIVFHDVSRAVGPKGHTPKIRGSAPSGGERLFQYGALNVSLRDLSPFIILESQSLNGTNSALPRCQLPKLYSAIAYKQVKLIFPERRNPEYARSSVLRTKGFLNCTACRFSPAHEESEALGRRKAQR